MNCKKSAKALEIKTAFFLFFFLALMENLQAIVGGMPTNGKFPFVVMLATKKKNHFQVHCTASMISKNEIITAAHCFSFGSFKNKMKAEDVWVYAGDGQGAVIPQGRLKSINLHPQFKKSLVGMSDLATGIVEWENDPGINEYVELPHWAVKDQAINDLKNVTMVGFGLHDMKNRLDGQKMFAPTTVVKMNSGEYLAKSPVADSCYGDSGGPLLHQKVEGGPWYLLAVTSHGFSSECRHGGRWSAISEGHCFVFHSLNRVGPKHCQTPISAPITFEEDLSDRLISDFSPLLNWEKSEGVINVAFNFARDKKIFKQLKAQGMKLIGKSAQMSSFWSTPFLKKCEKDDSDETVMKIKQRLQETISEELESCEDLNAALIRSERLNLSGLQLKSGELIGHLPRLNRLDLSDNQIKDIGFFSTLNSLKQVDLSWNPVCKSLKNSLLQVRCEKVDRLTLESLPFTQICKKLGTDEEEFSEAVTMEALYLALNLSKKSCLNAANKLIRQHTINLKNKLVKDLKPLMNLPRLEYLDLRGNSGIDQIKLKELKTKRVRL